MKSFLNLDLLAASTAIISTIMGGMRIRFTWLFSIFSSFTYVLIFASKGLMYNLAIHSLYLPISIFGALKWGMKEQDDDSIRSLPPIAMKGIAALILFSLLYILIQGPNSMHMLDIFTSLLSSLALILLSNHFLECWLIWFVCDIMYLGLFFQSHLTYSFIKSAFYIIFAMYSFLRWRKKHQEKEFA